MDVSFIIVNFNTKELTQKAIASLYKYATGFTWELIVVDNASEDGSTQAIAKKFPQVKLLKNKENLGFAKANNRGIKIAKGHFIFLFNSDAYLIDNSLKNFITRAKEFSNLGAIGPKVLNVDKSIQQSVGFFPHLPQIAYWMSFLDDLPGGTFLNPYHVDHDSFYKTEHDVDWLTGAALMVTRGAIEKAGLLDEKIFMYGEDVDWCFRIKSCGLKVMFSPVAQLVHIGSGSSGKKSKNAILGEFKGINYLYSKHKGKLALQLARILLKIGTLARILIFTALGRKETANFYVEALKMDR